MQTMKYWQFLLRFLSIFYTIKIDLKKKKSPNSISEQMGVVNVPERSPGKFSLNSFQVTSGVFFKHKDYMI